MFRRDGVSYFGRTKRVWIPSPRETFGQAEFSGDDPVGYSCTIGFASVFSLVFELPLKAINLFNATCQ